jgi:ribosomal protein L13
MSTVFARDALVRRDWYVVDASGKTLGRLATQLAMRLRGKHKPEYTPHVDTGDHIIVLNAEKIRVTGDKLRDKIYYWHTGAIGGIKSKSLEKLMAEHPGARDRVRGQGHAAEESARPAHVQEAARVPGRQAPARGAAAEVAGHLIQVLISCPQTRTMELAAARHRRPACGCVPAADASTSTTARSRNSSAARRRE